MGSLNTAPQNFAAFQNQTFPNGLDLGRCVIQQDLGAYYAAPGASFYQGSLVAVDTAVQQIVPYTGAGTATFLLGVAKWSKTPSIFGTAVDEALVIPANAGVATFSLKHPNLVGGSVQIDSAVQFGGTHYVGNSPGAGTDYTVNTTNGTITTVALGAFVAFAVPTTVYVSYTWTLSASDLLQFQGLNFWNLTDNVSIQDNRVTVITDWSMLFTTQYDTSQVYTVGAVLYANSTGHFTVAGAPGVTATVVGRVFQLPSVNDPFLGVISGGNPN